MSWVMTATARPFSRKARISAARCVGAMRIETRHRLVEHEQRPAIGDGEGGQREPALLALRELERMTVLKLRKAPSCRGCRNACGLLVCAHALRQSHRQLLAHGAGDELVLRPLEGIAARRARAVCPAFSGRRPARQRPSVDLPAPFAAENAEDLALMDGKIDAAQDRRAEEGRAIGILKPRENGSVAVAVYIVLRTAGRTRKPRRPGRALSIDRARCRRGIEMRQRLGDGKRRDGRCNAGLRQAPRRARSPPDTRCRATSAARACRGRSRADAPRQ